MLDEHKDIHQVQLELQATQYEYAKYESDVDVQIAKLSSKNDMMRCRCPKFKMRCVDGHKVELEL